MSTVSALRHLQGVEEIREFELGGFGRIGTMDRIVLDVRTKHLPERTLSSLRRVSGAHKLAMPLHRVLAFKRQHKDGSGRHEATQAIEEGPLFVNVVKAFRLRLR